MEPQSLLLAHLRHGEVRERGPLSAWKAAMPGGRQIRFEHPFPAALKRQRRSARQMEQDG